MLLGDNASLANSLFIALRNELCVGRITDTFQRVVDYIAAGATQRLLGGPIGKNVLTVAQALDHKRNWNVVDDELQEFFRALDFPRQRLAFGHIVEQRNQKLWLISLVARDHAGTRDDPRTAVMIDRQFITHRADGGLESFAIRLIDGLRSLNPIDRVRRASDDLIPADARELLKGAIGENIAAIIDAFRRDTDGNVVDHRFQEIPAVGEFVGELALFGAILMSGDEAAVGQVPVLDQNRAAVLEIADIPLALLGRAGIFLDGRLDEAPLLAQLQKIAAGHAGEKIETVETVHLEVAVVAKYDAFLRVEHHDAVGEVVERAGYKGRTPDIGMARAAQRRRYPENDRSKERNDHKAADQQLPDHGGMCTFNRQCGERAIRIGNDLR